jgi:hypothetical protein
MKENETIAYKCQCTKGTIILDKITITGINNETSIPHYRITSCNVCNSKIDINGNDFSKIR